MGGPDDVSEFLTRRWQALSEAEAPFTRPWHDLEQATAARRVDPDGFLGELRGKTVLCLAAGGGQQSAAFALAGADVTVLDLSEDQLAKDRAAAEQYGVEVRIERGDMRDLGRFAGASFDVVWHAYSINFVPEPRRVISEVARVLRPGGDYTLMLANPFASGIGASDWDGHGYRVSRPYVDGAAHEFDDPAWVYERDGGVDVPRPREYRHTFGRLVDELRDAGLTLVRLREQTGSGGDAEPGSWHHQSSVLPPWFRLWAVKRSAPS